MSLRARLTALYVLLLAFTLAAFGVAFYLIADHRLYASLDDRLIVRAEGVISEMNPPAAPLTQATIDQHRDELDRLAAGSTFQVRASDGTVLYSSFPQTADGPSLAGRAGEKPAFFTRDVNGEPLRLVYQPIVSGGAVLGSVQVAESLRETDEALTELRGIIVAGALAAIILTGVPTYFVAAIVLRPVRQLSQLAREVERTANFSRRLESAGPPGETSELVATFNAMIARVEHSLKAQGDFLADSSHELRRPLTVMRTNADMLSDPALPEEQRTQCLTAIRQESTAMSRLIADLLLLSREKGQAISRFPTDYSALCEHSVDRLKARDGGQHQIFARVSAGLYVLGDRERLAQMLDNVLDNAARYTPEAGRIEVEASARNGTARVVVRDTGIGIPAEEMGRAFERFFRGTNARGLREDGTGLGLAIVKYIAEAHGGRVQLTSAPSQGTDVVIDLPAAAVDES